MTPDVLVGTLGKSFGAQGAFVAGPEVLREWLWNRARSFVFSTGLAPASAAAALRSLHDVIEHPELFHRVEDRAGQMRAGLLAGGAILAQVGDDDGDLAAARTGIGAPRLLGFGHVVPVVLGSPARALWWTLRLRERGVHALAIRPPTVPTGTSRIRFTVTALHGHDDIARAVDAFAAVARAESELPAPP